MPSNPRYNPDDPNNEFDLDVQGDAIFDDFGPEHGDPRPLTGRPAPNRQVTLYKSVSSNYYFDLELYPQRYYLELYEDPALPPIDKVECPIVSNIVSSSPLAVTRTHRAKGSLYEEHSGIVQRKFKLKGRSGFSPDFLTRFKRFRNFYEKYAAMSRDHKNAFVRGKDITLVLNFPWEGESYYATILDFRYARDISTTTLSYEYELDIVTNGFASRQWALPDHIRDFLDCTGDDCHTGLRHPCHRAAYQAVKFVPPDEKELYVQDGEVRKLALEAEQDPVTSATGDAGVDMQRDLVHSAARALDTSYEKWDGMTGEVRSRARYRLTTVLGWYANLVLAGKRLLGTLFELLGSPAYRLPYVPGRAYRPTIYRGTPVVHATVRPGACSAADVARAEYGTAEMAGAIIQLNDLTDAGRYKANGHALARGDILRVPAPNGLLQNKSGDLLGTDLRLHDGDLVLVGDSDVALVSGEPNFAQNLDHRLETKKRTNRTCPNFGPDITLGDIDTPVASVLSEVKRQLLADHRTDQILQMDAVENGDLVEMAVVVRAVTGNESQATASFKVT